MVILGMYLNLTIAYQTLGDEIQQNRNLPETKKKLVSKPIINTISNK